MSTQDLPEIYGTGVINQFRILDRRLADPNDDDRAASRGRIAIHCHRSVLLEILSAFNLQPSIPPNTTIGQMTTYLRRTFQLKLDITQFTPEQIRFYYGWSRRSRQEICQAIHVHLEKIGHMI